jgi:hypothetical protein
MYFTAVLERIIYPPPPSHGFRQWTCSIKTQSRCKFGHFVLSSRTYCRVISEISTLDCAENLRTCKISGNC